MFEKCIEKFHLNMLNVGVVYDSSVARHGFYLTMPKDWSAMNISMSDS
jgi:hypothetical protein